MSIEGLDEFLDELRTLILEHPIVADWWAEISDRKDTADTPQTDCPYDEDDKCFGCGDDTKCVVFDTPQTDCSWK